MKLAFKIMVAVMLVVAILLVAHSYLVVKREVALFRSDMDLHAYLLGSVLASSVVDMWKANGFERVESLIADANQSEDLIQARWVWFDVPPGDISAPRAKIDNLTALKRGEEILIPEYTFHGAEYHISYFPVSIDSTRLSALELTQPLAPMYSYIHITIIRKIALFVAFLFVGGILFWWLGIHLVGTPIRIMVDQAHAVGLGDLSASNDLEHQNDEIGKLAHGLNQMVKDLKSASQKLDEETARRIEAIKQLNHAERLATVGKLASGLAHELGTPLNVVAGRAKMIMNGDMKDAEISDSATVIKNQAERMTDLIKHLLDFARSKTPEKTHEELIRPVKNTIHMLAPLASERNIMLDIQKSGETPQVEIDVNQIQQVLSNLIVNAIHAMPQGGRIEIRCGQKPALPPADRGGDENIYAFIEIIDNGVGIPKESLSRIFTPFFSTKQVGEGTGLGLSIAHGIIKEHGGWMTVDSIVNEGSTFTVYLPIGGNS